MNARARQEKVRKPEGGPGSGAEGTGFAPPPGVAAAYRFDRVRTWSFVAMLGVMIALGLGRIALYGTEGQGPALAILIGFPALGLALMAGELRLRGPILIIAAGGLLDRRHGPELIAWERIAEAEIKRRPFINGIRIKLTDGTRYDLELGLLRARPLEVMHAIRDRAAQAAEGR